MLFTMNIGGVEKSFLNLLSTLDPEKFEIDLLLLVKKGGFLSDLPEYVNVKELSVYSDYREEVTMPTHLLAKKRIREGRIFNGLRLGYLSLKNKVHGSTYPLLQWVFRHESVYEKKYDIAVSYASPFMFIDYYVVNKVKADKKICWIHFDISKSGIDKRATQIIYKGFDKINIVSNDAKRIFDETFPTLSTKTSLRYNEINPKDLWNKALEFNPREQHECRPIVISTVGRISGEKGQLVTIYVLRQLIDAGYDVEWWYVGEGNMLNSCIEKANDLGVSDRAKFFGAQKNPYPYMLHSDVYVQPSVYEGFCITLAESKVLKRPIVSTNFTGAKEQLMDYEPSKVVSHTINDLLEGVKELLDSSKK